jgi:hypothetical protein
VGDHRVGLARPDIEVVAVRATNGALSKPASCSSTDKGIDVANSQAQAFAEADADSGNRGYRRDSH